MLLAQVSDLQLKSPKLDTHHGVDCVEVRRASLGADVVVENCKLHQVDAVGEVRRDLEALPLEDLREWI
jgi:hypothetical protein